MSWLRTVLTIFRKELREGLRDPKTLLLNYIVPLVVYPLLALWIAEVATVRIEKETNTRRILLTTGPVDEELRKELSAEKKIELKALAAADLARLALPAELTAEKLSEGDKARMRDALKAEKAAALLACTAPTRVAGRLANQACNLHFDPSAWSWDITERILQGPLDRFEDRRNAKRIIDLGLKKEALEAFSWRLRNAAETARIVTSRLGDIAPTLFMLVLFMASFYPALNSTVGERERGTLATLLTLPLTPGQLITGKFLAVLFFGAAGVLAYFGPPGLLLWFAKTQSLKAPVEYTVPNPAWIYAVIVASAATLTAAIVLCVGFFGRKLSEAQGYFSMLLLVPMMPLLAGFAGEFQLDSTTALIPLFNLSVTLKTSLVDPVNLALLAEMAAANLFFTVAVLSLTVHLIRAEYRGDPSISDLLTLNRKAIRALSPATSVVLFLIAMVSVLYLNMALARLPILALLGLTHVGVQVLLPWAGLRYFRVSASDAFRLTRPSWRALTGAVIAGLSMPFVCSSLLPKIEMPKEMAEAAANTLFPPGSPLWLALLTVAILPAVAEELFFRGPLLRGFERGFPKAWCVLISAAMFALMHMSALRLLPTFIAGLVLGFAALRTRSVFTGMIIHVLNNGTAVLVMWAGHGALAGSLPETIPTSAGLVALGALAVALALFFADRKREDRPAERPREAPKAA